MAKINRFCIGIKKMKRALLFNPREALLIANRVARKKTGMPYFSEKEIREMNEEEIFQRIKNALLRQLDPREEERRQNFFEESLRQSTTIVIRRTLDMYRVKNHEDRMKIITGGKQMIERWLQRINLGDETPDAHSINLLREPVYKALGKRRGSLFIITFSKRFSRILELINENERRKLEERRNIFGT